MKRLPPVLMFVTVVTILLFSFDSFAAITLPWRITFNCADWTAPNPLSYHGLDVYGLNYSCSGTWAVINGAGNNSAGGGGKGWRVVIGDGSNVGSATPRISFGTPRSEFWIRWYVRYPLGFTWSTLTYAKLVYVWTTGRPNAGVYDLMGWDNTAYVDQYFGTGNHYGTAGWDTINGGRTGDGQWHCMELHLKTNTPGQLDGVAEAWIDGTRTLYHTDVNFNGENFSSLNINVNQASPANGGCVYVDYDDFYVCDASGPVEGWEYDSQNRPMIGTRTGADVGGAASGGGEGGGGGGEGGGGGGGAGCFIETVE